MSITMINDFPHGLLGQDATAGGPHVSIPPEYPSYSEPRDLDRGDDGQVQHDRMRLDLSKSAYL